MSIPLSTDQARSWMRTSVEQVPAIQGLSIEQQGPVLFFFLIGEGILFFVTGTARCKRGGNCDDAGEEQTLLFHMGAVLKGVSFKNANNMQNCIILQIFRHAFNEGKGKLKDCFFYFPGRFFAVQDGEEAQQMRPNDKSASALLPTSIMPWPVITGVIILEDRTVLFSGAHPGSKSLRLLLDEVGPCVEVVGSCGYRGRPGNSIVGPQIRPRQ